MPLPKLCLRNRSVSVLVLAGLICLGGCGGGGGAPVSGHVTVNGQPLTSGYVNFHPNKSKGNTSGTEYVGEISPQGEYKLQSGGKPGVPLGWYKVTVSSNGPTTPDNTNPSMTSVVNTTYSNPDTTTLEKEVVDKPSPGAYDLQVGP